MQIWKDIRMANEFLGRLKDGWPFNMDISSSDVSSITNVKFMFSSSSTSNNDVISWKYIACYECGGCICECQLIQWGHWQLERPKRYEYDLHVFLRLLLQW